MSGKSPRRPVLLLVPLALLALAGAWWGLSQDRQQPPAAQQPKDSPSPTPAAVAAPPLAPARPAADGSRAWVPGTLYRYSLQAVQKVAFRQKQPGGAPLPGMHISLQGEWQVGVVAVLPDRIDARVRLQPSSFSVDVEGQNSLPPETRKALNAALSLPFFVSFEKTGAAGLTHFEKQVDALGRGILRTLVASTQFTLPGPPKDSWKVEEYDTTGQYTALYRRLAADRFDKAKQSYSHVSTPQGLQPLGTDIRIDANSLTSFELAEDLWPRSIQGNEHLAVDAGDSMPAADNENQITLRLLERLMDPSLLGSLDARRSLLDTAPMSSFQGVAQDPKDHYRQILAGKSFDELLNSLRSLPKDPKARDDLRTEVLEKMRALFMLQPEEALKVPAILRSGLDPLAASPMIGALSAASTPQAIKALVEVTNDKALDPNVRTDAIAALGTATEPNQDSVQALRRLSESPEPELRETATLGYGNAAMQMRNKDERAAEALVSELRNDYRTAKTPEEQAMLLGALGNTRSPNTLATLQDALNSPSPNVREAAVIALRHLPPPDADRLLSERLISDPDPQVRRAVVFACGFRPLAPMLPALGQALRSDSALGVRSDIIQLLGLVRTSVPEAVVLLRWSSQNDPYPELRNAAASLLGAPTTPTPSTPQASPSPP